MNNSDEQRAKRQQLKVAFDLIDVDRSGAISSRDLRGALRGLGVRLSQQEVDALVREANSAGGADQNSGATGGGSAHDVEFPEFCEIMMAKEREIEVARAMGFNVEARRERKEPTKPVYTLSKAKTDEAKRVFNSYDFELAGVLDVDQIRSALEVVGFKKTEEEVAAIVASIDKFGSGQLNYNEFLAVVTAENERASGFGGDIKQTALHILQELGKTDFSSNVSGGASGFASPPMETVVRPVGKSGMSSQSTMRGAMWSLIILEAIIIVLFGACCEVSIMPDSSTDFTNSYVMYTGVALMLFFGYGYLMTYLKRYGMGAVAFSMLVTVISMQWGVLCEAFFKELYHTEDKKSWDFVQLDLAAFTEALILAAACLVSMGAVIGKASPLQLIVMTFFECIFYSVNKNLLLEGVVDVEDGNNFVVVFFLSRLDEQLIFACLKLDLALKSIYSVRTLASRWPGSWASPSDLPTPRAAMYPTYFRCWVHCSSGFIGPASMALSLLPILPSSSAPLLIQ
jgi:ammonium transporter Rh